MNGLKFAFLYYSIIAMGGDGTVNAVMNALLNKSQKEADVEMKHGFMPVKALKPLGIIPVGKSIDKKKTTHK